MIIQAIKFILWVEDMDRAVAFYRDVFGLDVRLHTPHWSELRRGDATLALHAGRTGDYRATGLAFQVDDVDRACAEVEAGGGRIRRAAEDRPRETIRLADLEDPEGNGFQLSQFIA